MLHVIPAVAKRYGGPSTAIIPLVQSLLKESVDVLVAATEADGPDAIISLDELPLDFPIILFKVDVSEVWKVSFEMRRWLKLHIKEYDLVHIHAVWSFSSTIAARLCYKNNVPYVLRPAGMLSSYSLGHKGWKKCLYWQVMEHNTIGNESSFHATSDGEKRDIIRIKEDADVYVIPNGVEDEAFTKVGDSQREWLCKYFPLFDEKPFILYLSRLHPKKGITGRLLPAFVNMTADANLIIAQRLMNPY